jgi:asparagine synthase (glutamine-hydrolysing)
MCAIAGLLNLDGSEADPKLIERMIALVRHRGPDAAATHVEGNMGFGHARLSIIDLAGGAQPMSTADRSLTITFNGEIFNYKELREDLIAKGYRFETQSDTEVILHLYREHGEDCVSKMNGQWAFAVWDARRRHMFLSRDRLGIRPLFYVTAGNTFVFGSEIKCLLAHPDVPRRLNFAALDQIFTFWCRTAPETVFEKVLELPPGHSMTIGNGKLSIRRYWTHRFSSGPLEERESAEQLFDLLVDATRIRLRSDVPVGAYLSGGIDSTVTAGLIRRFSNARLKTFSVSFDDAEFDESDYQQKAIRHLDTEHQNVRCKAGDIARVFPDVIWHAEQPVLRTAPAPMFLLSRLVRQHGYKVVLTGEGADEVLGGYDIFKEAKIRRFCAAHPESPLRPLLLKRLYPYLKDVQRQPAAYLRSFFRARPEDLASPFFSHLPRWELTSGLKLFFSDEVRAALRPRNSYAELQAVLPEEYSAWDGFAQAQYLEAAYLLPGYILSSQGDRVAMAHSVEGRMPFLDYRVVEFGSRLPAHLKMKVLQEKYLLKRCVNGLIPAEIKKRTKQPYRAPEGESFFKGPRQPWVEELLAPERVQQDGVFNPSAVQALAGKFRRECHASIRENMAMAGILSTQLVIDQFIRRFGSHN